MADARWPGAHGRDTRRWTKGRRGDRKKKERPQHPQQRHFWRDERGRESPCRDFAGESIIEPSERQACVTLCGERERRGRPQKHLRGGQVTSRGTEEQLGLGESLGRKTSQEMSRLPTSESPMPHFSQSDHSMCFRSGQSPETVNLDTEHLSLDF